VRAASAGPYVAVVSAGASDPIPAKDAVDLAYKGKERKGQGLTLLHFSAQPEMFLVHFSAQPEMLLTQKTHSKHPLVSLNTP